MAVNEGFDLSVDFGLRRFSKAAFNHSPAAQEKNSTQRELVTLEVSAP
jgi:hypothetical protein